MKEYFGLIVSAAVLAGICECLAPDAWKKYLNIISGIMMVSVILSPIPQFRNIDLFSEFKTDKAYGEQIQQRVIISQLQKKIELDAAQRIYNELGESVKAEVELSVTKNGEIAGVKELKVWVTKKKAEISKILAEAYSPSKITFVP